MTWLHSCVKPAPGRFVCPSELRLQDSADSYLTTASSPTTRPRLHAASPAPSPLVPLLSRSPFIDFSSGQSQLLPNAQRPCWSDLGSVQKVCGPARLLRPAPTRETPLCVGPHVSPRTFVGVDLSVPLSVIRCLWSHDLLSC